MILNLDEYAANRCVDASNRFAESVTELAVSQAVDNQKANLRAFPTARQIGTVYSLFVDEDLRTLLNGFVSQARAMSMLFAAAGGLIEAQDEALAGGVVEGG